MTGTTYNGYSWQQREAIMKAFRRGQAGADFSFAGKPCGLCGDPDRPASEWHSEDYSQPYSFVPPQSYPLCKPCHSRLHKRFDRPAAEWEVFCRHVDAGGTGQEFTALYPPGKRDAMCRRIAEGLPVDLPRLRERPDGPAWWRGLTLDPESLAAPWARPRPLRPRPGAQAYRQAIAAAAPTEKEAAILRFHAAAPRRTVTMRTIARQVLNKDDPRAANLAYGRLARRIGENLDFEPDRREDGSFFWMSVVAEGWEPRASRDQRREYELVMIPALGEIFGRGDLNDADSSQHLDRRDATKAASGRYPAERDTP
ncbi:hypothetical protein [Aurantimonas coralicida]|uniref:hypothetical protein n=1 Tax=Aurantimonas coralicida TaxID=182270 RepID=UPI001E574EAD|nr:hypothetical protein [Aurantimonas coralicida]MCD1645316.1 hypothetical protein [Aurantimonas coralicida]